MYFKHKLDGLLFITLLCCVGCELISGPEVDDFAVNDVSVCRYSGTLTFDISSDVTTDFNETNVNQTARVTSSNCSDVGVGETSSSSTDRVYRSGNTIVISNNGSTVNLSVSGTNLSDIPNESASVNGVQLDASYTDGSLNTSQDDIIYNFSVKVTRAIYITVNDGESENQDLKFKVINFKY